MNIYNSGDVKSGIRIEFRAIGAVTNPVLLNVDTREFIKLNISLVAGDVLTVSTGYGEKAVKLNRGGTITCLLYTSAEGTARRDQDKVQQQTKHGGASCVHQSIRRERD